MLDLCRKNGSQEARRAGTGAEAEAMWRARRAISPALSRIASGKLSEDIVVPRSRIPEMLQRLDTIRARHDLQIINFGHAGDGNIHVNVMYDKKDSGRAATAEEAVRDVLMAALDLGGTISGEHGIGTTKKAFIKMEIEPEVLDLMKRIKKVFDPDGIMNPGKVFPS